MVSGGSFRSTNELPPRPPGPPGRVAPPTPSGAAGRVIDADVTGVGQREVDVRLADGRPGVIARDEFPTAPAVGSTIRAALLARDDPKGRVVLSHTWARQLAAWDRVEAAAADGSTVVGRVLRAANGGLVVDLGVRAFLPASMVDEHPVEDLSTFVGTDVAVIVAEVDRANGRLVVSRRDQLRRARRDAEKQAFTTLRAGSVVTGRVVAVVDYGLQLDVGGARGLLHRSELSWGRPPRPSDVAAVGDELEVAVIEVNRSRRRIGLSLRRLTPDPLEAVVAGERVAATVTRVLDYGVFARLDEAGVEGLVHVSEMSELPGARPDELVTPGEQVVVKVLSVDPQKRRIALSIRQGVVG